MARPPNPRKVARRPQIRAFKPTGRPARDLGVVRLGVDELEALRLADLDGLYHEAAAERMGVSRVTFGRVVARARAAVAEAIVDGKLLVIDGGPAVEGGEELADCPVHWGGRRRGRGCRCGHDQARGKAGGPTEDHRDTGLTPESHD
jgi:predicted DNA-binding protein (UPF0251 family)